MDFDALFPELPFPKTGPGVSYCIAPSQRMFDFELRIPGQCPLRGCIRAVDEDDARRLLLNRHPSASNIQIGKGREVFSTATPT